MPLWRTGSWKIFAETEHTKARYTPKQGQYLSFIHYYTKIHGLPPSEADMQRYFRVSPPAVHQMILTLEARGLIERVPRTPRSVRLVPRLFLTRPGVRVRSRVRALSPGSERWLKSC